MTDQLKTIREALENALSDDKPYIEKCKQALAALAELEKQEPMAFVYRADLEELKHANYMRIGAEGPNMYRPACDAKAPDELVAVYATPQPTPEDARDAARYRWIKTNVGDAYSILATATDETVDAAIDALKERLK